MPLSKRGTIAIIVVVLVIGVIAFGILLTVAYDCALSAECRGN